MYPTPERPALGSFVRDQVVGPADLHHLVIQIEAACRDPRPTQQLEELATPAADVEDVRRAREVRQVALEPGPDDLARAAELILEPDVLVVVEGGGRRSGVGRWEFVGSWALGVGS